jgi:pyruvate dehydrogenase E1 component alpha subunit
MSREINAVELGDNALVAAYRTMQTIRIFEERLSIEIAKGEIPGFTHLYAGQEACAVGVCDALTPEDMIVSTHRGHGHAIAKGCNIDAMMAEIFGKATGLCHGKSGSMHIADLGLGMLGANGIVGGGPPLAVGAAIAARNQGQGRVSVAFGGDGSVNQGTVLEALNMAVVLKLPVIFVFENNEYSEHTHHSYAIGADDLTARNAAFGLSAERADGTDYFAVRAAMTRAVDRARACGGPSALELSTHRFYGHVEGDPQNYRADGEVRTLRETRDCLKIFRDKVRREEKLPKGKFDEIDEEVQSRIDKAVDSARSAPVPPAESLTANVYHSY